MFQALIKLPEEVTQESLSAYKITTEDGEIKLVDIMASANIQRTSDKLWNTRTYYGNKVVNMIGNTTMARLQATMDMFDLDWEIMAANDGYTTVEIEGEMQTVTNTLKGYDKAKLLKFQNRINVYNGEGTLTGTTVPTVVDIGKFTGFPDFEET